MRNKFCFKIVQREFRVNRKKIGFYWLILCLLLTVTITILEAERVVPDMIAQPVSSMQADRIIFEIREPSELKDLLENITYTVYDCSLFSDKLSQENLSLHKHDDAPDFDGTFLFNISQYKSFVVQEIRSHLSEGEITDAESESVFLSEKFSNVYDLHCGDTMMFRVSDTVISKLQVGGVYSDFKDCRAFYISEDVYSSYHAHIQNSTLQVTIAPAQFRDIFPIMSALNKKNINYLYSNQAVGALSVLYILFTSLMIVLLIALFSILSNLLQLYYNERKRFFAINSAIGMNGQAYVKVLGLIAETIVISAFVFAYTMSNFFINWLNIYTGELFGFPAGDHLISIYTVLIAFGTVQADVVFVLIRFFKKNDTTNIISLIREN